MYDGETQNRSRSDGRCMTAAGGCCHYISQSNQPASELALRSGHRAHTGRATAVTSQLKEQKMTDMGTH